MNNIPLELLVYIASSSLTLSLVFFSSSSSAQYVIISLLIAFLIITYRYIILPKSKKVTIIKWLFFFSSNWLVQLLVFLSGGFYSSIFILLHLYALALGFFISLRASLFFILFTTLSLLIQLRTDPRLIILSGEDPGTAVFYIFSYFVVIPFCFFLAQQFQIKASFAALLETRAHTGDIVLEGISELVFITNLDLIILSANGIVERTLILSKNEIIGKRLFDVLYLKTPEGKFIDAQLLSINSIITQKEIQNLTGLSLFVKNTINSPTVSLTIKPIPNLQGSIDQLTFILNFKQSATNTKSAETGFELGNIQTKQQTILEKLKNVLISEHQEVLAIQVYLLQNLNQDMILNTEIKHLQTDKRGEMIDIAQFINNIVIQYQKFTNLLNTPLLFKVLNFTYEDIKPHLPKNMPQWAHISPMDLTSLYFSAPIDLKWFDILLHKLIFISVLLSLSSPLKRVEVSVERYDESNLRIKIASPSSIDISPEEKRLLFVRGYGSLSTRTYLQFGSGLEGLLAQEIARALNITLETEYEASSQQLIFNLYLSKNSNTK